jgi:predicted AAA+ superfamily ATPase
MDYAHLQASFERWQKAFIKLRESLIPRERAPKLPNDNLALALMGVRRCGKTTLALQLSKKYNESEVLYYNFEDPLFLHTDNPNDIEKLFTIFEQKYGKLPILTIFDEIQNVTGWERWLRSAIDQRRSSFIVTGSNAKLLSAELATSLTGRCLEYTVWPLSLSESVNFISKNKKDTPIRQLCLQELINWGGLPAVLLTKDTTERDKLLQQYLSDLIHRDVLNRYTIRNKRALDLILTYYQTNLSSLHSYSAIKKAFNIPIDTISEYTSALSSAFLLFEVERYHHNLKVQSRDPRKVYVVDAGLRRASSRSVEADIGKLLENLVFLELKRNNHTINYYKETKEVDFIVTENYKPKTAIQVCAYGMEEKKTRERELDALLECLTNLKLSEGTIVTMDRDEIIKIGSKTIKSVSAIRWLD